MIAQRAALVASTALFGVGLWQAASGLYIHAKAILAQHLLEHAWQRMRGGAAQAKPWPWADTWPVARLGAAGLDGWVYVLADASGRSLAFGPGHVAETASPGRRATASSPATATRISASCRCSRPTTA